jgi:hypothetical protein
MSRGWVILFRALASMGVLVIVAAPLVQLVLP